MGLKDKVSEKQLQALADLGLLNIGEKNDPSQSTFNAQTPHGVNSGGYDGLFSDAGFRDDFYSAMPRVRSLTRILNFYATPYENERLLILTGQQDSSGNNATSWCATSAPTPGNLKICRQNYPFGEFRMMTQLQQIPTVGGLVDRADVPKQIRNNPAVQSRFVPDLLREFPNTTAQRLQVELYKLGVAFERAFERVAITGARTNTGSGAVRGFMSEFDGLDVLVNTGYTDTTSVACPAADSMVITFGTNIDGTISGGDGRNIVDTITDLVYAGQDRARQLGLEVEYVLVMRQELFRALTDVWACQYNTSRCELVNTNDRRVLDAMASNQLRVDLLTGYYLLVDGVAYPVVISEGIPQGGGTTANQFTQDMYLLPLSVNGEETLYVEYFDMNNAYLNEFVNFPTANGGNGVGAINNGLFLASALRSAYCYEYHFGARMRMILRTPFLAGRVDNITFSFRAPVRSPFTNESFYANGGQTYVNR